MYKKLMHSVIFNTLRILKNVNPGDAYYEAYLGHLQKSGADFYDLYMLLWEIGCDMRPHRILEIGTRTGLSLCQLMSAFINPNEIEKVVCVDPFLDEFTSPALVLKNLKYLNLPTDKVEIITGFSKDVLEKMIYVDKDRFDYILVDGDHTKEAARLDLEGAHRLIAPGGVICFDDISTDPGECGLIDVWLDWKNAHKADYDFHEKMVGKGVAWAFRRGESC
jgi:cephalosporin hydroxylase